MADEALPVAVALDCEGLREIVKSVIADFTMRPGLALRDRITDAIWPLLEHAQQAAAGSHEGVRLWMLDCGELVAKHRARAEAAEGKLTAIEALCRDARASAPESVRTPSVAVVRVLAIIGETGERSEEEADHGA